VVDERAEAGQTGVREFLDYLSKTSIGKRSEIEIVGLAIGDQIQVEWLLLLGISYDPKDDVIEIALEELDHMITGPREVFVDLDVGGLTTLQIIDRDGLAQIVKLRDPPMLPPPAPR
jgi:hypothetical protein